MLKVALVNASGVLGKRLHSINSIDAEQKTYP